MSMNGRPVRFVSYGARKVIEELNPPVEPPKPPVDICPFCGPAVQLTRDLTSAICRSCGAIMPAEAA